MSDVSVTLTTGFRRHSKTGPSYLNIATVQHKSWPQAIKVMNGPERNGLLTVLSIFRAPVTVFPLRKKRAREASIESVQNKSVIMARCKGF
jgi:hypothetical protein